MSDWSQAEDACDRDTIISCDPELFGNDFLFATGPASTATGNANQAVFVPVPIQKPFRVAQLFCRNGATLSGNIDMGIYDDQKNRLVSIGPVAQAGISLLQVFDITDTLLLPGMYYLACAWTSATATLWASTKTPPFYEGTGLLTQAGLTVGTLPNPAVWTLDTKGYCPLIGMTQRAII